jgi:hypothetical protein
MSEVNYNETIVLPYLQRKFQELTNQVLILEVNLQIEQAKNKALNEKIQQLETVKESPSKKKKTENIMDGETY